MNASWWWCFHIPRRSENYSTNIIPSISFHEPSVRHGSSFAQYDIFVQKQRSQHISTYVGKYKYCVLMLMSFHQLKVIKTSKSYLFHQDPQGCCGHLAGNFWPSCQVHLLILCKRKSTQVVSGYIKERSNITNILIIYIYMQSIGNYSEVCLDILFHLKLHMVRTPLLEYL